MHSVPYHARSIRVATLGWERFAGWPRRWLAQAMVGPGDGWPRRWFRGMVQAMLSGDGPGAGSALLEAVSREHRISLLTTCVICSPVGGLGEGLGSCQSKACGTEGFARIMALSSPCNCILSDASWHTMPASLPNAHEYSSPESLTSTTSR